MKYVYLCGPIKDLSLKEASDWRQKARLDLIDYDCLDPMRRNFKDHELQSRNEIVQLDKADIIEADILLVNATKPSWGTAMEVMFAHIHHKVIIAFAGLDCGMKTLSPWLAYHATRVFISMEDAVEYIKKQF